MKPVLLPLVLALALTAGCNAGKPHPAELQVGQHRVSVVLPEGWEHIDYGDRHQLRKNFERITIEDLGWLSISFDKAVRTALHRLKEREQRDEASRKRFELGGLEAVVLDTWDKLSHQYRKRFFFVKTRKSLLTIYMMQGEFESMEPAFDSLIASFALVDSLEQAGLDDRDDQPE